MLSNRVLRRWVVNNFSSLGKCVLRTDTSVQKTLLESFRNRQIKYTLIHDIIAAPFIMHGSFFLVSCVETSGECTRLLLFPLATGESSGHRWTIFSHSPWARLVSHG